jgi:hypothetical protein
MRAVDTVSIVVGVVAMAFGVSGGKFYAGMIRRRKADEPTVPRWFGRLWFFLFGIAAISNGLWHWF